MLCQRKFNIQKKPILCGFLVPTYKKRSHIRKLERSLSIFMCQEKKRGGGTNLEGGDGVFIEWCESLCNDRSLMKSSLGFWFTVRWARGSLCDRYCIPAPSPPYTDGDGRWQRASSGHHGPLRPADPPRRFQPASSGQGFNIERWLKGGVHPNLKFSPHSERNLGKVPHQQNTSAVLQQNIFCSIAPNNKSNWRLKTKSFF